MKLSNRILASAVVIGALACAPAAARASTVNVEEVEGNTNLAVLHFAAGPGEQNKVTVMPGPATGETVTVQVTDAGAPLTAGAGCTGGGPAGTTASCTLRAGRPFEFENCGRDCSILIPGTAR